MNRLRYQFLLTQIANLEASTQEADDILAHLRFPETPAERIVLSRQLDALQHQISISTQIARQLASDVPQIVEVSYD